MENNEQRKVLNTNDVFGYRYLDINILYLYYFNEMPSMYFIGQTDAEKVFVAFKEKFNHLIADIHQYQWYKRKAKKYEFYSTVVKMKNNCIVEFDGSFCKILHNETQAEFLDEMTGLTDKFKERQRREPLEINLIVKGSRNMELKAMEIKRTKLDLNLFYEDDFKETDELIRKRLNQKKDKGIVLLHGLPGAGKTTYLRYLIGKIRKRVLFLSTSVAGDLMHPDFIQLLIENPDTVLIIEDAENIIMDRKHNPGSAVSNLLNISDGLLADCLNVQMVCTFNSSLTLIDSALLRKGRLIAKYEFGKLGVAKSQKLSDHLGFDSKITKPMTVADIANQNEKTQKTNSVEIIGFRRELIEN